MWTVCSSSLPSPNSAWYVYRGIMLHPALCWSHSQICELVSLTCIISYSSLMCLLASSLSRLFMCTHFHMMEHHLWDSPLQIWVVLCCGWLFCPCFYFQPMDFCWLLHLPHTLCFAHLIPSLPSSATLEVTSFPTFAFCISCGTLPLWKRCPFPTAVAGLAHTMKPVLCSWPSAAVLVLTTCNSFWTSVAVALRLCIMLSCLSELYTSETIQIRSVNVSLSPTAIHLLYKTLVPQP